MLLAALNLLHEKLKGQEGGTRRRQVAESAVTKLIEKLGSCLIHEGTSASTESSVAANWQQVSTLVLLDTLHLVIYIMTFGVTHGHMFPVCGEQQAVV